MVDGIERRWLHPLAIAAALALVGFITFAIVSAVTRQKTGAFPAGPPASSLVIGKKAPTFSLKLLGAVGNVALTRRASQPTIVNFFASWCANCVAELHAFGAASHLSKAVRFVGVDSLDPAPGTAIRLLGHAGVSYAVGVDRDGAVADRYLIAALPVTFFISRAGVVRGELFGAATLSQLTGWVHRLDGS